MDIRTYNVLVLSLESHFVFHPNMALLTIFTHIMYMEDCLRDFSVKEILFLMTFNRF